MNRSASLLYVYNVELIVIQVLAMEHLAKNNAYFSQLENYVAGNSVCYM